MYSLPRTSKKEARKRLEAGETQRSVARSQRQSEHDFEADGITRMSAESFGAPGTAVRFGGRKSRPDAVRVLRQQGWISDPRQTIGLFAGPCPETDPRANRADRRRWVESDPCAAACRMTLCAEADDHSWGERIAALGPKGPFLVNAVGEPVGQKQKITAESSRRCASRYTLGSRRSWGARSVNRTRAGGDLRRDHRLLRWLRIFGQRDKSKADWVPKKHERWVQTGIRQRTFKERCL